MRVLVVNKFLHHVGGVETYVRWLAMNLPRSGHQLAYFGMKPPDGVEIMPDIGRTVFTSPTRDFRGSFGQKASGGLASIYSREVGRELMKCVREFAPDVVHLHSTCFQLTPVVENVASRLGIPMVMTLHEYKLVCSNQRLWDDRKEAPCFRCVSASTPVRVKNMLSTQCVKGSAAATLLAAAELPVAQYVRKRSNAVLHAPSRYMKATVLASGEGAERVVYNDLPWGRLQGDVDSVRTGSRELNVLYTGRLAYEKGVDTLLEAWRRVQEQAPNTRLTVYGTGLAEPALRAAAAGLSNVTFAGAYDQTQLSRMMSVADLTVHPSRWPENSPFTVRESLLHGVPVVVSDAGGLPEMVDPQYGQVFPAGDAGALARTILLELESRRARTAGLMAAVAARHVSDNAHLEALERMYAKAKDG